MEAMLDELKKTENLEQLAGLENELAGVLGNGFLKGRFDYQYLSQVKEQVEQIEAERREQFQKEIPENVRRPAFKR